jgi:hypothetical protein
MYVPGQYNSSDAVGVGQIGVFVGVGRFETSVCVGVGQIGDLVGVGGVGVAVRVAALVAADDGPFKPAALTLTWQAGAPDTMYAARARPSAPTMLMLGYSVES